MSALTVFVLLYISVSIGIGLYAARKVANTTDFVLAGRSLPIYVTIATVFATWFGSEAVLGIPATFIDEGMGGIVADPFGAGMCLIFVGVFFAARLYRMKLMTIGDFFRHRYGRTVELLVSLAICISYLGWVAAQVVALGLLIDMLSGGTIGIGLGMIIGIGTVMLYTMLGGMISVAITDFIQMMFIIVGLIAVAIQVSLHVDGGATTVVNHAWDSGKFAFWPEMTWPSMLAFVGAFITMGLGSIPQQDVFQRVMSAKDEKTAVRGTVIGGGLYIIFCFIPIFITCAIVIIDPQLLQKHMGEGGDTQRVLLEYIMNESPLIIQILFFGALLSAIMSTASGTLLAPSVIIAENILRDPLKLNDKSMLVALRLTIALFGGIVLVYGYLSTTAGMTIFEMVENAYLVTLCGAFVPLAFGVYWKRASTGGALLSILLGVGSWAMLEGANLNLAAQGMELMVLPPQLAGLCLAIVGMLLGSHFFPITRKDGKPNVEGNSTY